MLLLFVLSSKARKCQARLTGQGRAGSQDTEFQRLSLTWNQKLGGHSREPTFEPAPQAVPLCPAVGEPVFSVSPKIVSEIL